MYLFKFQQNRNMMGNFILTIFKFEKYDNLQV